MSALLVSFGWQVADFVVGLKQDPLELSIFLVPLVKCLLENSPALFA